MTMAKREAFPSEKLDQYMLRFPDGMRERLKEEAAKNNRSLNAEIIARLEGSFEAEEKLSGLTNALVAQERHSRTLAEIQEAYAEMALILGSAALSPEIAEKMRKDDPDGLKRLTDVFGRHLAEIRAVKSVR